MSEMLNKMRAKQGRPVIAEKPPSVELAKPPAPAALMPLAKTENHIRKPKPTVKYACGHELPAHQIGICSDCRSIKNREKAAKNLEKRQQKKEKFQEEAGSLPDGAFFESEYSAERKTWAMVLTVVINGETKEFSATGSNYDRLSHLLAGQCRAAQLGQQATEPTKKE